MASVLAIVKTIFPSINSCIAQIVTGNMSVEDGLASYKATADSLNLDQALAEMNEQ